MLHSEAQSPILGVDLGLGVASEPPSNNRNNSPTCLIEQCLNFIWSQTVFQDRSLGLQRLKRASRREKIAGFYQVPQHGFHTSSRTSPTAHQKTSLQGDKLTAIAHARAEERDTTCRNRSQMFWPLVPYSIYPVPLLLHCVIIAA